MSHALGFVAIRTLLILAVVLATGATLAENAFIDLTNKTEMVMPKSYKESLLRFLDSMRPQGARLFTETRDVKVFAYISHSVVEKEKFDRIVREAISIRWPDSPHTTKRISWETWQEDLRRVIN